MSIKVDVQTLRAFQTPLLANNQAFIDVLYAVKKVAESAGEGTGVEEALLRDGQTMEKLYNGEVVPAARNVLNTLAAAADNAEDIKKLMDQVTTVNTSKASETQVQQGVRAAAFKKF